MAKQWTSVLAVSATAFITVIVADRAMSTLVRFGPPLREVQDATEDYERSDPTVLVLGSSHARSFEAIGKVLAERTNNRVTMVAVPLEWGKLSSYLWVLRHRLAPLIEEVGEDERPLRPSLRHFILVTEWWDSCPVGPPGTETPAANLPARAWVFSDFIKDALRNGLTDYNKNYLTYIWTRAFIWSPLVRDRGHETIKERLRNLVSQVSPAVAKAAYERRVHDWHVMLEGGAECMWDPYEINALEQIVAYFRSRAIEVTIVLYPKMPITLTNTGVENTLKPFSKRMQEFAAKQNIRLLDWTLESPLRNEDWEVDFDHLTPEGDQKLAEWALAGDLAFLLEVSGKSGDNP